MQPDRLDNESRPTRRRVLKLALAGTATAAAAGGIIDAMFLEPKRIDVSRPVIELPDWPPAWDSLRVVHLTDLHLGRLIGADYLTRAVEMANAARPDLAVLTGDFVTHFDESNVSLDEILAGLRAPLGRLAVLGNHDYAVGADRVAELLTRAGVTVLRNDSRLLMRDGAALCVAGVEDMWRGRPDLAHATRGVGPDVPRIVLVHNPDYADNMPEGVRADVLLCGHTHGGQVRLPWIGAPRLPIRNRRYASGLAAGPRCCVYVSRGLGMVGVPVRLSCRPEMPVLTFRRRRA
jgi:predicted MPP superfamily phosphohydrolase